MELADIAREVEAIKKRNDRVAAEKAWEVSRFRVYSIACVTYIVAVAILFAIGNAHAFRNAFVPVAGYILSTQSLPLLKRWWIAKYCKKISQGEKGSKNLFS